jgi:ubiquinol-cytochrome c reductase cytochrome c1 subunit
MKRLLIGIVTLFWAVSASAAGDVKAPKEVVWPFDGIFGTFDRQAAQRGYQVYKEVCAGCHSMRLNAYRNLLEIGFSEAEVKQIASEATVIDGPNDDGDMFERPGRMSDRFASPFANEKAARASNNGAYPPDLSLLAKARPNGANYIYSLLTGYEAAPADVNLGEGMYYNSYFPGSQIAMASPLSEDAVEYQDGTQASVDQMARDVVVFLQWAAEPEMEQRKRMGVKALLYLFVFTILFYFAKKRIWQRVK